MKKTKFLSTILLVCFLCACSEGVNKLKVQLSPQDKCIGELVSQIYSTGKLNDIAQFEERLEIFDDTYPIECIRECDSGFRVAYLGQDEVAIVTFNLDGKKTSGYTYALSQTKAAFDSISEGSLLSDVQEIDPKGNYSFLYTGRNDVATKSIHYTIDGYMLIIEYDESDRVIDITSSLI